MIIHFVIAFICISSANADFMDQKCLEKNDFLKDLEVPNLLKVPIFNTTFLPPSGKSYDSCAAEWNTYGSCCNPLDLTLLNFYENYTIFHFSKKMSQQAVAFHKLVRDHKITVEGKDKYVHSKLSRFQSSMITCWDHITEVRSSALCSICSGRSNIFFPKNLKDKSLLNENTCIKTLKECEDYLSIIQLMEKIAIKNADKYEKIAKKSITIEEKDTAQHVSDEFNDFISSFAEFKPEGLMRSFSAYEKVKSDCTEETNIKAADLCQNFLNIRGLPFNITEEFINDKRFNGIRKVNAAKNQYIKDKMLLKYLSQRKKMLIRNKLACEKASEDTIHNENKDFIKFTNKNVDRAMSEELKRHKNKNRANKAKFGNAIAELESIQKAKTQLLREHSTIWSFEFPTPSRKLMSLSSISNSRSLSFGHTSEIYHLQRRHYHADILVIETNRNLLDPFNRAMNMSLCFP